MIKFEGTVSDEIKLKIKKKEHKAMILTAVFTFVLFGGLVVFISLLTDLIVLLFLILVSAFSIMLIIPQKGLDKRVPKEIIFGEEKIELNSDMGYQARNMSDVKEIYDRGDWYEINFSFPHKSLYYVCQKSLIKQGTIEEFEFKFKDKLIKK